MANVKIEEQVKNFHECCLHAEGVIFDNALYDAFSEKGTFSTPGDIAANQASLSAAMTLVDKAYGANFGRYIGGNLIREISGTLLENNKIKDIIARAWEERRGLSRNNYARLAECVAELNELLHSEISNSDFFIKWVAEGKSKRKRTCPNAFSFASKFLHFVSRSNPPVDKHSCTGLTKVCSNFNAMPEKILSTSDHGAYIEVFYNTLVKIYESEGPFDCHKVKKFDCYLLHEGMGIIRCPGSCKNWPISKKWSAS